ncbi:MAG: T9SS type A sorting domain-containing protein, partial [Rubricoccaceae bacterium]|nr:T9SS type A sorting domain-containing protein [Rubricoccaceae bacterium]
DTLLVNRSGSVRRSTDGGRTWAEVRDLGGGGLFEMPQGYPFAGRVFAGGDAVLRNAVGYSDDRGATFADALMQGVPGFYADAEAFAAYPPGSPWAGRLLAAGRWGASVSDDGGEVFTESGLWDRSYRGEGVAVVAHPGGGHGAIVGGRISATSGQRAWSSGDGGATWGPAGGVRLPEAPPIGPGSGSFVLAAGGMSALAVLPRGTVYRTDDAGATWAAIGRAPEVNGDIYLNAAALSPDGRLYVGLLEIRANGEGWVWRTEVLPGGVPVPVEAGPEGDESLGVEVSPNPSREGGTVTLTLARPSSVSVAVYDGLGRRVAVLHEGPLPAGRHTLAFDRSALPPGVYVVRVEASGTVVSRRVTVLR